MSEQVAREVSVHGTVQGVGFRYYTAAEADRLGVHGWVRNEPDGSVTLLRLEQRSNAVSPMLVTPDGTV